MFGYNCGEQDRFDISCQGQSHGLDQITIILLGLQVPTLVRTAQEIPLLYPKVQK